MDASGNSARNELKEFRLRFINVLINILASPWSRSDEGESRTDRKNKAVEHSVIFIGMEMVRGATAPSVPPSSVCSLLLAAPAFQGWPCQALELAERESPGALLLRALGEMGRQGIFMPDCDRILG